MRIGTYWGDGTTSKKINRYDFRPKYLRIWEWPAVGVASRVLDIIDVFDGVFLWHGIGSPPHLGSNVGAKIIEGGFEVTDQGTNTPPNTLGAKYGYLLFG